MIAELAVSESTIRETCGEVTLPRMGVVEQLREPDPIPPDEIAAAAADAVGDLEFRGVPDGGEVAVGAGSRGIANLAAIVRGVVDGLRDRGYEPFVFLAMGSHGGAMAEAARQAWRRSASPRRRSAVRSARVWRS